MKPTLTDTAGKQWPTVAHTLLSNLLLATDATQWQTPEFCKARNEAIRFLAAGPMKVVTTKKGKKT